MFQEAMIEIGQWLGVLAVGFIVGWIGCATLKNRALKDCWSTIRRQSALLRQSHCMRQPEETVRSFQ